MSVNTKKLSDIGLPTKPRVPRAKVVKSPLFEDLQLYGATTGRKPKVGPLPPKPVAPPPVDLWVEAEKEFIDFPSALYEFRYYKRSGYTIAQAISTGRSHVEAHKQQLLIKQHNKELLEKFKDCVLSLDDIKATLSIGGNALAGFDRVAAQGASLCVCCGAANPRAYSVHTRPGEYLGGNRIWWQYAHHATQVNTPVRAMEEYVAMSDGFKAVFNWEKE